MVPYHAHLIEPRPFTDELRAGRALELGDDERLIRVQVWSVAGERTELVDLLAVITADQFNSTFSHQSAAGPLDVRVTILR